MPRPAGDGARGAGRDGGAPPPYPPAPWRFRGQLWAGAFPVRDPLPLPCDLRPLGGPHRLVLGLVRYREGTLVYDELALGPLVRRGRRVGLLVDRIWVSDTASVRGGRGIWRLPKEPAEFEWGDRRVTVRDRWGVLAGLAFRPGPLRLGPLPMALPGFSGSEGRRLLVPGRLLGTLRQEAVGVTAWSERLPPLARNTATFSVAVRPFRMTVPGPVPC